MRRALVPVVALAALPGLAHAAIVVEQAELRASLGNLPTTAAYMTIRNTGAASDRLVGADCACAAMVMVHQTTTQANGVSHMGMEAAVAVPPGAAVRFAPNGRHLMLTGVKAPIRPGAKTTIVLRFEKAGPVRAVFVATDTPGMADMPGMNHQKAH